MLLKEREMNKEIVEQLEKTLREKGNEIAISKNNLNRYTVNSVAFQQYPRDCYSSIEEINGDTNDKNY